MKKGVYTSVVRLTSTKVGENTLDVLTTYTVRFVGYLKIKTVIERGITSQNLSPVWYEHTDEPFIVAHKKTGKKYLQCMTTNNPRHRTRKSYVINGELATKEQAIAMGLLKEKKSYNDKLEVFTIPLNEVISIG